MLKKSEWIILEEIRCESAMQHHSKTDIFAFFFFSLPMKNSHTPTQKGTIMLFCSRVVKWKVWVDSARSLMFPAKCPWVPLMQKGAGPQNREWGWTAPHLDVAEQLEKKSKKCNAGDC